MILPIYKGKGDPLDCGSYRGIKLLEHAMKVAERIFKHRIRQQIDTDNMQFGFMEGKGNTDAIFIVRQMQEKFKAKGKKFYFGFVDFLKAFDKEERACMRVCMCACMHDAHVCVSQLRVNFGVTLALIGVTYLHHSDS